MSIDKSQIKAELFVVLAVFMLIFALCTSAKSQKSFVGVGIDKASPHVTTLQEMDAGFARVSLLTRISTVDPQFRLRFGCAIYGKRRLHGIVYAPQFNLSLKYAGYNTPFGAELRWLPGLSGDYLIVAGTDYFLRDYFSPYIQVYAKFK